MKEPRQLSRREAQVLSLYRDARVTDIARRLNLSVKTITTNLDRAQVKLGLDTRHQLLRHAVMMGAGE